MQNVLSPIVDMVQAQIEASRQMANVVFSGTEKIDRVVIEATHRAVDEQLKMAQTMTTTRDPQGMSNFQSSFFSKPDGVMPYQQEIMRIFAEMQNEMGRSIQKYMEQVRGKISNSATAPFQAAQQRATETVVNPITGMFSLWESAFQEVASMANKNISAGRSNFESAASSVRQATNSAMDDVTDVVANAVDAGSEGYAGASAQSSGNGQREPARRSEEVKVEVSGGNEPAEEKRPASATGKRK